jgi:hypothetical protein
MSKYGNFNSKTKHVNLVNQPEPEVVGTTEYVCIMAILTPTVPIILLITELPRAYNLLAGDM